MERKKVERGRTQEPQPKSNKAKALKTLNFIKSSLNNKMPIKWETRNLNNKKGR